MLGVAFAGCRNPNDVDAALLAPRLLHDEAETEAYVQAFPEDDYRAVPVPEVGRFWVDGPKDIVKDELRQWKVWEPHLVALLREHVRPGTTVVDAGAYVGTHTVLMARLVGAQGRVYAFEPQRKPFRELRQNVLLNGLKNVVALRFALGAQPAVVEMDPATPGNGGGTAVGRGGDRVELRTLDSFGFKNVSAVKIDVEGFESQVLDGARETLQREKPVLLVEILGNRPPYRDAPPEVCAEYEEVFRKIERLGYEAPRLVQMRDYLALPRPR